MKPITVDAQVYEAKLNDSYELGRIFSHLVHKMDVKSEMLPGETPSEFVIRQFREEQLKFAKWLVAQQWIKLYTDKDGELILEDEVPEYIIEEYQNARH